MSAVLTEHRSSSASHDCGCGGGAKTTPERHPCGCACPECRAECCDLECLVHPRFYCGQLLTDHDLSLLVDWVKNKTGLARYRDGWGVVCGLDVRCCEPKHAGEGSTSARAASAAGDSHASVIVTAGYAISCCGDDIVVCKDTCVDLASCCQPPKEPCEKPRNGGNGNGGANDTITIGGKAWRRSELSAVDLYLQYRERPTDPQAAVSRRGCSTSQYCEYGRIEESYALCARPVDLCDAPDHAAGWIDAYRRGMAELYALLAAKPTRAEDGVRRLSAWLDRHPATQFCFLRQTICEPPEPPAQDADDVDDDGTAGDAGGSADADATHEEALRAWYERAWLWLAQDWRNQYFRCACHGCDQDEGVPLARIILHRTTDKASRVRCRVIHIDPYPPYRRPIRIDCLPAPAGHINLSDLVWEPADLLSTRLAGYGIRIASVREFSASEAEALREPPIVNLGQVQRVDGRYVLVYTVRDHCDRARVVTIVPWVEPNLLRLDAIERVGEGRAARLQNKGIKDAIDLARADTSAVLDAFEGIPGTTEHDADALIKRAREHVRRIEADHPDFRPLR